MTPTMASMPSRAARLSTAMVPVWQAGAGRSARPDLAAPAHSAGAFHSVLPMRRHHRLTGTSSGLATAAANATSGTIV